MSIIEVGANNEYGHPHLETLQKLQKVSTVYRTDIDDTVTITTDGSTYSVTTEKTTNSNPVKSLLPVADFNADAMTGYAPLSVKFTDLTQNEASRKWDFTNDGIVDSSDLSPIYTYTVPGTYNVNLKVSNANGTTSKTVAITVQEDSSSSGNSENSSNDDSDSSSSGSSGGSSHSSGGSGGGGAGGSPEPQSNVEVKETSQAFVTSGKEVKFNFTKNATYVVYVTFNSKKTVGKTTAIAEMLKGKSSLTSGAPSDEIYKFLNIWIGNGGYGTSDSIENPVVCFKVEKSWIQDNNVDQSSITLNRYIDNEWNQLSTNLSDEDDKYLYFTAKTSGFSQFAITGKTKVKESVNETESGLNIGSLDQKNESTATSVEQTPKQKENTSTPGFEMIYGIIGLLGVFLCRER